MEYFVAAALNPKSAERRGSLLVRNEWRATLNSDRRPGAKYDDYFLAPFAMSWMLSPAFSICCPTFSTARSTSLPVCSAGPACFSQPTSAAATLLCANFLIVLVGFPYSIGSRATHRAPA